MDWSSDIGACLGTEALRWPLKCYTHVFSRAVCDHLLKYENNVLHQVFRHASFHLLLERPWVVEM